MAHRYLLDTNILSDLIRRPRGVVARRIEQVGEQAICTSIIVAGELRYGAEKSGSPALAERVALILSAIDILALDAPADRSYARIRYRLARDGNPIGPNDLLIAAQALTEELVVVTANEREFRRVGRLQVENWLAGQALAQPEAVHGRSSK